MSVSYTHPVPRFGCKLYNYINNTLCVGLPSHLTSCLGCYC